MKNLSHRRGNFETGTNLRAFGFWPLPFDTALPYAYAWKFRRCACASFTSWACATEHSSGFR